MKKIIKVGLSCLLALTVAAPIITNPQVVEAASTKSTKKSYTTADRAYIKHQSAVLYKLRTQTEDLMNFFAEFETYQYEGRDYELYSVVINKMDAWDATFKQAIKYRPQDVPAKFKKAQTYFAHAMGYNAYGHQLIRSIANGELASDEEIDATIQEFMIAYAMFKGKAAAFDEEIRNLNKTYQ